VPVVSQRPTIVDLNNSVRVHGSLGISIAIIGPFSGEKYVGIKIIT
jgi:hypothetical protein